MTTKKDTAIRVSLANRTDEEKRFLRVFTELRDVELVSKREKLPVESVKRYLRKFGILTKMLDPIKAGAPLALTDDVSAEPVRLDVVEKHKLNSEISALRAENKALKARAAAAEDHRASVLGLSLEPADVPDFELIAPKPAGQKGRQAVVLHLSDLHVGEVVNSEEVMGVNEYDLAIAEKRIGKLFRRASILSTSAWPASDMAPEKVFVLLGGDLVSGHGLHPELAETDAGTAYEQTKWAADYIASGLLLLSAQLEAHFGHPVEIIVISVPGNHGRSTPGRPRFKLAALQSYDTLVADFVEAAVRAFPNIKFFRSRSFDAYFNVVGWPCLLTHGDRMGGGGGAGYIGPMASIVRGHRKVVDTEYRQRRPVRFVFSGHYHTTGVSPFGFGNGSGVGFSEFAKGIRGDPEPAQQNYVVLHERIGMLRWQPIAMGSPGEGSIYEPNGGLILPEWAA